ncbi:hypothetical protein RchiOBHm_Chr5g0007071 [Rosa chinensis]|uniref:Uncharacterized protein n=1 Tax=Rosa chinensis TaxID=74649 RepID=A0A2P6Q3R3_ROSCH|nr:hypothetical protein RchiOBHm_Chr5g0007071 [Rosa chinensis]
MSFKRTYITMVEMCHVVGNRDQLITMLLPLVEHVLNVFLSHFQYRHVGMDLIFFLPSPALFFEEKGCWWQYM